MVRIIIGGIMAGAAVALFFYGASAEPPNIDEKDPLTIYLVLYDIFQRTAVVIGAAAVFVGGCIIGASHRPSA
jgi:hypothetical protein